MDANKDENSPKPWIGRPSDIPIYYSLDHPVRAPRRLQEQEVGVLQEQIGHVRRALIDPLAEVKDTTATFLATGKAHTQQSLEMLREEENVVLRASFVGGSSLCGYAFGALRGGRPTRLFYFSLFALGSAALGWPKEAKEIGNEAMMEGRKYAQIGINFVKGAMPSSAPVAKRNEVSTSSEKSVGEAISSTTEKVASGLSEGKSTDK